MSFKVLKKDEQKSQYAEPIQQKIDNAAKFGTVYVLGDEDNRIQALYNRRDLVSEEVLRYLERVRSPLDNKEYLVASKKVNFYNRDTGAYVDSFINTEGIVEEPIVSVNDKGESVANETRTRYTTPFSEEAVDEYLDQTDSPVPLSFYEGTISGNRAVRNKIVVGSADYFKEADWHELQLGQETGLVSSMVNTLDQVRELKGGKARLNNTTIANRKLTPQVNKSDRTPVIDTEYESITDVNERPIIKQHAVATNVDSLKIQATNPSVGVDEGEDTNKQEAPNDSNNNEEESVPAKQSRRGNKSNSKQ